MATYGYARVSTTGQTLETQKALLLAAGAERIFSEKVSGVAARRPELERALDQLEAGDCTVDEVHAVLVSASTYLSIASYPTSFARSRVNS